MRGQIAQQARLFSYLAREDRIPADHPLGAIRTLAQTALRALLVQGLYSVRSERQLMEQMECRPPSLVFWACTSTIGGGTRQCSPRAATNACETRWRRLSLSK